MSIQQETIDRVDRWHAQLDFMARSGFFVDSGVTLASGETAEFTADEIRRWPELKAAMVRVLATRPKASYARVGGIGGASFGEDPLWLVDCHADLLARGLVMFRSSLAFLEATKASKPVCLCGPQYNRGTNPSCPEHGERCRNVDCDKLCDTVGAYSVARGGVVLHFCCQDCALRDHQARIHAGPTAEQVRGASPGPWRNTCARCGGGTLSVGLCSACQATKRADPICACGASLATTKEVGSTGRCGECFLDGDRVVSMALTRAPAFPDVSRPVVPLAGQAHPLGYFSGRRRRYL